MEGPFKQLLYAFAVVYFSVYCSCLYTVTANFAVTVYKQLHLITLTHTVLQYVRNGKRILYCSLQVVTRLSMGQCQCTIGETGVYSTCIQLYTQIANLLNFNFKKYYKNCLTC